MTGPDGPRCDAAGYQAAGFATLLRGLSSNGNGALDPADLELAALRRRDGLQVDVHLLADVDVDRPFVGQLVDDLQHAVIDALGVVAGQALLGDDVWLDVDELQAGSGRWGRPLSVAIASELFEK